MDHNRVDIGSLDSNRGSKLDNGWVRGSTQKDSHCDSKVDCNGWLNPRGSLVDTKGWLCNHKGSKLDYFGFQVYNTWTKNSDLFLNINFILLLKYLCSLYLYVIYFVCTLYFLSNPIKIKYFCYLFCTFKST